MKFSFVSLLATDKVRLPGLLYEPAQPPKKAAVWLHGMGDNGVFYKPHFINPLGEALAAKNIALLAMNNRGAHNRKSLKLADEALPEEDRSIIAGTHYERIADCVKDIDGATDFLKARGFSELYLLGHSTGANKVCAYQVRAKHNPYSKYVLAGPGDDSGLYFVGLGPKRFWQALKYAARFAESDPLRTMPRYTGMYPFSAASAWDIMNPDGAYNIFPFYEATNERLGTKPLFAEYSKIDKPSLIIMGSDDEYAHTAGGADKALNLMMHHASNAMLKQVDFQLIDGADHSFHGAETEFASRVADWLAYV